MKNLTLIILMALTPIFAFSQVYVKAPNGHTGIGIDTPTQKLDVNGNAYVRGTSFMLGANSSLNLNTYTNGVSNILHSGVNVFQLVSENSTEIDFRSGGNLRMRLWKNGPLQIWSNQARKPGGGPWLGASDKRLKRNIQAYEKGLEELLQVNPVSYYYTRDAYKNAADEQYVGVIAQELQQVVPTMVGDFELTDQEEGKSKGTYLSVDPNEFTYMLINAAKEQQDQIESLEQEVADLKEMVNALLNNDNGTINQQNIELNGKGAYLEQNQPNPFNSNTIINYHVPADAKNAIVNIFDSNGQLIHTERVAQMGAGQIQIKAGTIAAGTYSYSLVVDGNIVDTKRMAIVK